jgi:hypothetical protein
VQTNKHGAVVGFETSVSTNPQGMHSVGQGGRRWHARSRIAYEVHRCLWMAKGDRGGDQVMQIVGQQTPDGLLPTVRQQGSAQKQKNTGVRQTFGG